MINTDRFNITNSKVICETIPFYARGRKLTLLLEAISSPLVSIHDAFKEWALERMIEASVTSQSTVLIWYLNHVFRKHFKDKNDSFEIVTDAMEGGSTIWFLNEQILHVGNTPWMLEDNKEENVKNLEKLVTRNYGEVDEITSDVLIYAPQINESISYGYDVYKGEIRKHVDKYLTVPDLVYEVIIKGLQK